MKKRILFVGAFMLKTLPQLICENYKNYPENQIQLSKNKKGEFKPVTYKEFFPLMTSFSAGLYSIGERENSNIGLISDDRKEWLVCSFAILSLKCADIPRGSEATAKDLQYILDFAECKTVVIDTSYNLKKILQNIDELPKIENIIIISNNNSYDEVLKEFDNKRNINFYSYDEILQKGKEVLEKEPDLITDSINSANEDDTATIIFTSGTTGTPKGVELTHKNFICQLEEMSKMLPFKPNNKCLCVLPVWHVYQRFIEYLLIYNLSILTYSKPVGTVILADFKAVNPEAICCVPRIWESIYAHMVKIVKKQGKISLLMFNFLKFIAESVKSMLDELNNQIARITPESFIYKGMKNLLYVPVVFLTPLKNLGDVMFFKKMKSLLGPNFKVGMSGGGGLPLYVDKFFSAIGVKVVEGYGLTETAPMCCIRNFEKPVMGTIGPVLSYDEYKIVTPEGKICSVGEKGILYVKGPNIMKGYYKRPDLTAQVIDKDGFFNTGDLVIKTVYGDIMIKGRSKDTIVLRSGENVEPLPIENKLAESSYISLAIVVGQDQNNLGALILPDFEAVNDFAKQNGICGEISKILITPEVKNLFLHEIESLINMKTGFKSFEKVTRFEFLVKPFEIGKELSPKQGIMRYKINEIYSNQIKKMFS